MAMVDGTTVPVDDYDYWGDVQAVIPSLDDGFLMTGDNGLVLHMGHAPMWLRLNVSFGEGSEVGSPVLKLDWSTVQLVAGSQLFDWVHAVDYDTRFMSLDTSPERLRFVRGLNMMFDHGTLDVVK